MKHAAPVLVLTAILAPVFYLTAQEAESAPGSLEAEMKALNVTMKEIAALLQKHVAGQETELLIQRVELANRALISRREELAETRAEVGRLSDEEAPLRINIESYREGLSQADVSQEIKDNVLGDVERFEKMLEPLEARRKDLERRMMVLENEVATYEEDMRILESVLDERLGLR